MDDPLRTLQSLFSVGDTIGRLAAAVERREMAVFARVDHGGGATAVGMALRPTELLVFGSPRAGTPLMQVDQAIGLDLPLKALAWEDASGTVWLSWRDPAELVARYGLDDRARGVTEAMARGLEDVAREATGAAPG